MSCSPAPEQVALLLRQTAEERLGPWASSFEVGTAGEALGPPHLTPAIAGGLQPSASLSHFFSRPSVPAMRLGQIAVPTCEMGEGEGRNVS